MAYAPPIPSPFACWLITLYQRYLSPRKGFRCAYRVRHRRRDSCSQYAKRAIGRLGLIAGLWLLRRRMKRCRAAGEFLAARTLDYEPRPDDREEGRRFAGSRHDDCAPSLQHCDPSGLVTWNGDCDLPGDCDCGGCDVSW